MIGGAFGAKLGAYLGHYIEVAHFDLIATGLATGGVIGLLVVLATSEEIAKLAQTEKSSNQRQIRKNTYSMQS